MPPNMLRFLHRSILRRVVDKLQVKPFKPLKSLAASLIVISLAACGGDDDGEVGVVISSGGGPTDSTAGLTVAYTSDDDLLWCGVTVFCPTYNVIPFNANLQTAPSDGAYLIGTVRLEVVGNAISSVALLPANSSGTPIALFNIAPSGTYAWLDLDTSSLEEGPLYVRIDAFNIRYNEPSALKIEVMKQRTWNIQNGRSRR